MADNVACEQGGSQYSVVGVNVGWKFIGGDSRFQSSGEVAPSNCSDTGTAAVKIAPSGSFSARHARRGPSGIGLWRRRAGLHLSNANDLGKWVPSGGFLGFTIKAEDATTCVCAATTPDSNYHLTGCRSRTTSTPFSSPSPQPPITRQGHHARQHLAESSATRTGPSRPPPHSG